MDSSYQITTDASLSRVMDVLRESNVFSVLRRDEKDPDEVYRAGTPSGGYVTIAADLKIDVDEMETWMDIYEQTDEGLQFRLFDILGDGIDERVTRFSRDGEKTDPGETANSPAAAA